MTVASGISIVSIADVPWADVELVFGTRGDPARCWCQFFKMPNAQWWATSGAEKSAGLHEQVVRAQGSGAQGPGDPLPPGLLAYLDGEPVGWCAIEPRTRYPLILRSKVVTTSSTEAAEDDSVWAISCFVVRVGKRRKGVGQALANAAVEWARAHGARVIEGYPVDIEAKPDKVSAAALYHGSVSIFEQAGFTVRARPYPGRALMRLEV
jgi:GNAT superfamily N-acetyltransferase